MLYSRAIETPQKLELSIGDLDGYVSVCDQVDVLACIGACGGRNTRVVRPRGGMTQWLHVHHYGFPPCLLVMGSCQPRLLYGR